MTSDEFHELAQECSYDFDGAQGDPSLTLSRLAQLEQQKGISFPHSTKSFLACTVREILVVSLSNRLSQRGAFRSGKRLPD